MNQIIFLIPENTDDIFVDVEHLEAYREICPLHEHLYGGLVLGFGKNVFVFDVKACEFFKKKEIS